MAQVQADDVVSRSYRGPDRRRGGPLGKLERWVIDLVHSKWVAMFVVSFAVSLAFDQVDNIGERRMERQQRVIICVVSGVDRAQAATNERVVIGPILKACEEREDNG